MRGGEEEGGKRKAMRERNGDGDLSIVRRRQCWPSKKEASDNLFSLFSSFRLDSPGDDIVIAVFVNEFLVLDGDEGAGCWGELIESGREEKGDGR